MSFHSCRPVNSKLAGPSNFIPAPGASGPAAEILDPVAEVQEILAEDRGQEEEIPVAVAEQRQAAVVTVLVGVVAVAGKDNDFMVLG